MALTKRAIEKLRTVEKQILADPKGFDMGEWGMHDKKRKTGCDTVACIAGWICVLSPKLTKKITGHPALAFDSYLPSMTAKQIIGEDDIDKLFYTDCWKEEFEVRFSKLDETQASPKQMAKLAVEVIEDYIKDHSK